MNQVLAASPHSIDVEFLTMGLHDLGASMSSQPQKRIDEADSDCYDAILLGYALCGRGTEGLRAGRTQLVLPRAHDCIGLLMGSRQVYQHYFDTHPGVSFRSPGWLEYQRPDQPPGPGHASSAPGLGERRRREERSAQEGEENGRDRGEQVAAYRRH